MKLKPEEIAFLKHHGYGTDDVYDANGQSSARWKSEAKRLGKLFVLGSPCAAAGHRLRMRAGHCAQCDPKKISYQKRYSTEGYVYIAGSLAGRVVKIGTAINILQRENNLRAQRYGGLSDWQIIFWMKVSEGGRVEQEAIRLLGRHHVKKAYLKDGATQIAGEILSCGYGRALKAIADANGDSPCEDVTRLTSYRDYEFSEEARPISWNESDRPTEPTSCQPHTRCSEGKERPPTGNHRPSAADKTP